LFSKKDGFVVFATMSHYTQACMVTIQPNWLRIAAEQKFGNQKGVTNIPAETGSSRNRAHPALESNS
jgi:hypothetical protein